MTACHAVSKFLGHKEGYILPTVPMTIDDQSEMVCMDWMIIH